MIKKAMWLGSAFFLVTAPAVWASTTPATSVAAGSKVFHGTCVACHGADGTGAIPGTPNFTDKSGVLTLPTDVLVGRVMHGFQDSNSPMAMPPKGGNPSLTKQDVQNVLAYLRHTFLK